MITMVAAARKGGSMELEFDRICSKCLGCTSYATNGIEGEGGDCMGSTDARNCTSYRSMTQTSGESFQLQDSLIDCLPDSFFYDDID